MGWVELIGLVLKLGIQILVEVFEEKKRARLANEKYELTRARFEEIAQECLKRMRDKAAEEAKQAQSVEDQLEAEARKKGP